MNYKTAVLIFFFCHSLLAGCAISNDEPGKLSASNATSAFTVKVLGTRGGLDESNLSAYLVADSHETHYLALDAGNLYSGIQKMLSRQNNTRADSNKVGQFLTRQVEGYAITHAHMDHIAGLVINATDDSSKPIYALPQTISVLKEHIFNWQVWPNFANEGVTPQLGKYQYRYLTPTSVESVDGTSLNLEALPLSHGNNNPSTAFLIRNATGDALLYLGDTGPDEVEGGEQLLKVWKKVSLLIKTGKLKAIFIEASYPDPRSRDQLFGHLTPFWVQKELTVLAQLVSGTAPASASDLSGISIVITHNKPSFTDNSFSLLQQQLSDMGASGFNVVIPSQGDTLQF